MLHIQASNWTREQTLVRDDQFHTDDGHVNGNGSGSDDDPGEDFEDGHFELDDFQPEIVPNPQKVNSES